MKKLLLISALTAMSIPAFAATQAHKSVEKPSLASQYFSIDHDTNFKHWSVSGGIFSRNYQIPNNVKDLDIGYIASVTYNFNPNLYASLKTDFKGKQKMEWSGTVGMQGSSGKVRPYIEAALEENQNASGNLVKQIGYDGGLQFHIVKWATPYIEMDNFLEKDREAVAGGVIVPLPDSLALKVEYDRNIQTKGDSAQVRVYYSF